MWWDLLIALGAGLLAGWLALLMVYLALPIDLVPDFLPVIGYVDDAIIVAFVLRSVVRQAGIEAIRVHWPGTESGFAALARLTGLHHVGDDTATAAETDQRADVPSGRAPDSKEPARGPGRRSNGCACTDGPVAHPPGSRRAGRDVDRGRSWALTR